jgi:anti-sigma regulatory factor (Ser/Thr protein kinase)
MSATFESSLRNDMESMAQLPPKLEAFAEQANLPADVAMHIDIVLDELLINTISYGYRDGRAGTITVRIVVDDQVTVVIEDDGDAFDPLSVAAPDLEADLDHRQTGGLGVHFVRTMMDTVFVDSDL